MHRAVLYMEMNLIFRRERESRGIFFPRMLLQNAVMKNGQSSIRNITVCLRLVFDISMFLEDVRIRMGLMQLLFRSGSSFFFRESGASSTEMGNRAAILLTLKMLSRRICGHVPQVKRRLEKPLTSLMEAGNSYWTSIRGFAKRLISSGILYLALLVQEIFDTPMQMCLKREGYWVMIPSGPSNVELRKLSTGIGRICESCRSIRTI